MKRPRIVFNFKKVKWDEDESLYPILTSYRMTINTTGWYRHRDGHIDKEKGIDNPEVDIKQI